MNLENYKFVIVGGGTAGWLSALFLKTSFPQAVVTVVESSEIGILGAGEGTVPDFTNFLKAIGISISDIIYHAQGTFKNGIKFTNWNGDGQHYFHGFGDIEGRNNRSNLINDIQTFTEEFDLEELNTLAESKNFNKIDLSSLLSCEDKVKFSQTDKRKIYKDPMMHFNCEGSFALHFDAQLLAKYLKKVAISRGIQLIDAKVISVVEDSSYKISDICLDSGVILKCDFVIDCSGFSRLFIGNHYKETWKSYSDFLPVNRAIPFLIDRTENKIPPYTEAIAMKYGWMWKIPVGDRYGCGYVFDGKLITDEQAKQEIEEFVGYQITSPKTFSFDPGTFLNTWKHNVLAVGLAANFIEPLEATSIWVTTVSLGNFIKYFEGYLSNNLHSVELYNTKIQQFNEDIAGFIYFHYLTERNDTEFWKKFHSKTPEQYKNIFDGFVDGTLHKSKFALYSYARVGAGTHKVGLPPIYKTPFIEKKYKYIRDVRGITEDHYNNVVNERKHFRKNIVEQCVTHEFMLNYIYKIY